MSNHKTFFKISFNQFEQLRNGSILTAHYRTSTFYFGILPKLTDASAFDFFQFFIDTEQLRLGRIVLIILAMKYPLYFLFH